MYKVILLLGFAILISCKESIETDGQSLNENDKSDHYFKDINRSSLILNKNLNKRTIEISEFLNKSSQIFDTEKEFIEIEIDTIFEKQTSQDEIKSIYDVIQRNANSYRQIELRYNRSFTVTLYELRFDNVQSAKKMFETFQAFGMTQNEDSVPGLTYTNDYIRLDNNSVFWLNSPCIVSIPNHFNLVEVFQEMLELSDTLNEKSVMHCKCGAIFCTLGEDIQAN